MGTCSSSEATLAQWHGTTTGRCDRLHGDLTQLADEVLIREAQQGDSLAFADLVRRYDRQVLRLALRLTGSEHHAQDMYQEAFLRAYRELGRFRFGCSFYTWLYRITTNVCLDYLRRRQTHREDASVSLSTDGNDFSLLERIGDEDPASSPERLLLSQELGYRIREATNVLSPRERIIFGLKHYHGLKLRTIAGLLQVTEGGAKVSLYRAIKKLRVNLADLAQAR
jgi:RNA polymerase sigma-70 factor (ECF subfamily)